MTTAKKILEQHNLAQTYWGHRIITAEEAGKFTPEDEYESAGWTTCACGKLNDGIPRGKGGIPKDEDLKNLGRGFYTLVYANNVTQAAETLVAIEKRAIEVLTELTKGETL